MTKKKILIIGPAWPLRGGLATYNERLCREFNSQGHECEIASFSLQYPQFLFPGKTQMSDDPQPTDIVIHSIINSINPINWLSVGYKLNKKQYDLVIFRYWMSFMAPAFGTIARLIRANGKTKIITIADNIIPHEQQFFDTAFTQYFIDSNNGFLAMSREVYTHIDLFTTGKPKKYVPHPMYDMFGPLLNKQEAKRKLGLDENCNYLLFFGFIRKYKGLTLLLNSFALLQQSNPNLKLIVAGEFYENSEPYLEQIKNLGLANSVILRTDFIPNNEVGVYFSAADLVVQTYITATQSGVTQIAYYYNKPMLVTNVGGLSELVPHKVVGYVVERDEQAIAQAISDYYTQNKEAEFTANIEVEKQKFTWKYLTEELLDI
ncbi:MAG: glycosyltransferase [Candidatus Methylacidiphilales bacterium]